MSSVAVVGAGLTGLVAAWRLAAAGRRVTVFERWPETGGLVASFEIDGEPLECFYHHVFTTDADYVALADELGLAGEIEWLPSRMGIVSGGQVYDFGTPASLMRFSPLRWADKARFALSTLYLTRRSRLEEFEGVTAREWILRHAGRRVYDAVWGPLLEQKFAERAPEVSMAWLWYKLRLRGRSRSAAGLGERLGYMRGSFARVVAALTERVLTAGARIELKTPVLRLRRTVGGIEVETRTKRERFDEVLFTASPQELLRVAADELPEAEAARLASLASTAALCAVLELDRPLTPYYWLNVADSSFPFGGVIEHTNFVPARRYGGRRVVYLSKYVLQTNPLWRSRDDEVLGCFLPHLARLNPAFDESWLLGRHVFRAAYAQPLVPVGYSLLLPPFQTALPGLYHACMAQIYPEDRGQSYAVRAGERAARAILEER